MKFDIFKYILVCIFVNIKREFILTVVLYLINGFHSRFVYVSASTSNLGSPNVEKPLGTKLIETLIVEVNPMVQTSN